MHARLAANTSVAALAAALLLVFGPTSAAHAQCGSCAQPTVAYSPVVQTAYSPVYQTVGPLNGWYPGKWVRRFFGWGDPVVAQPAAVTAAYQPTYPASYSVGYAPQTYSAGYAPASYSVGYAPASYSVGYAASSCDSCGCDPCSCTASRPVTLSPVCGCESGCASCCGGGGVTTAGYDYGSSCPNCVGSGAAASYEASPSNQDYRSNQDYTPTPGLPQDANVPEQRDSYRVSPPVETPEGEKSLMDGDEASYFRAPKLFAPQDRTTKRPTAPVWHAVYKRDAQVRSISHQQPAAPRAGEHKKLDASGWGSASR